jgi:hypothetical protein
MHNLDEWPVDETPEEFLEEAGEALLQAALREPLPGGLPMTFAPGVLRRLQAARVRSENRLIRLMLAGLGLLSLAGLACGWPALAGGVQAGVELLAWPWALAAAAGALLPAGIIGWRTAAKTVPRQRI